MSTFLDMIDNGVEVFMDDFLVFGRRFDQCLDALYRVLQI